MHIHPLEKAISAHGDTVTELRLRAPTAAECRQIGLLPYRMGASGVPDPNLAACAQYISRCASIPPSAVDQLELDDFHALTWVIVGFFWKSAEATPAETTGSPSSTAPSTTSPGSGD